MNPAARAWPRYCRLFTAGLLLAVCTVACGEDKNKPSVGSNSNWLRACASENDCSDASTCLCGACSASCSVDADCAALESGMCALAAAPAARSQCLEDPSAVSTGMCLPRCTPGGCLVGQACVSGSCVLYELPAVAVCEPVADRSAADRAAEESLLELLQLSREQGGLQCQAGQVTAPVRAFRIDARLTCAARVLAVDLEAGTGSGLNDAQGRDAGERLELAGHSGAWAEMAALGVPSADRAFSLLTTDEPQYCSMLASEQYSSVGVGHAGNIWVVTLATP